MTIWSTMSQPERASVFENLARTYERDNPGVKISIEIMPWDGTLDKVVASIMAKNPPEITIQGSGWPQVLAGTGGIIEMGELINEIGGPSQFLEASLNMGKFNNAYYSMPFFVAPYIVYYRKSYLQEAGITRLPTTWEEFYDMCKAVTDPAKNRYGFAAPWDMHSWKTVWLLLQSNNVNLVNMDASGRWFVDVNAAAKARIIEVYEYLYRLSRDCSPPGVVSYTLTELRPLVANGNIMSTIDTAEVFYNVRALNNAAEILNDIAYFPFPGRVRVGSGTGWVGWGIQKDSNVALAKDYLKWLYTGDRMVDLYAAYPYSMFPVKNEMFRSASYKAKLPPELQQMMPDMALNILSSSAGLMMANGPFPFAGEVESRIILGNPLVNMFTRGISAAQAADELIAELEALLR
jgi:ABC-type glycerol-3-phosphate transport system substrate-binding protein